MKKEGICFQKRVPESSRSTKTAESLFLSQEQMEPNIQIQTQMWKSKFMTIGATGAEDRTNLTLTIQLIEISRLRSLKLGKTQKIKNIMTFVKRLLQRLEWYLTTQSRNKPTTAVSLRRMKMKKMVSFQETKSLLRTCLRSVFSQLAGILNGRSMMSTFYASKAQVKRIKHSTMKLLKLRNGLTK